MAGIKGFLVFAVHAPAGFGEDIRMAEPIQSVMAEKTFDIGEEKIFVGRAARGDFKHRIIKRNKVGMVKERSVGTNLFRVNALLQLTVIEERIRALRAKQENVG